MSDEEKEALEILKAVGIKCKGICIDDVIINLIEKQQKEIEELKANKGYHLGFIDGGIAKRYEYEDKIKAKIEEYEQDVKDFEEYWSKDPRKFKKEKSVDYYKLEALKELLEKE